MADSVAAPECRPSIAARVLIAFVRLYQMTLSWLLGGHCRFTPSCSNYAIASLRNVGAWRGTVCTLERLSRCHPFHAGGYDPPPPPRDRATGHARCNVPGRDGATHSP